MNTATIKNGQVICNGYKLEPATNPATNEHGYEIGMSWIEVIAAGGTIWVSDDGQPHVDAKFSSEH